MVLTRRNFLCIKNFEDRYTTLAPIKPKWKIVGEKIIPNNSFVFWFHAWALFFTGHMFNS
jgi:hypothetical protein